MLKMMRKIDIINFFMEEHGLDVTKGIELSISTWGIHVRPLDDKFFDQHFEIGMHLFFPHNYVHLFEEVQESIFYYKNQDELNDELINEIITICRIAGVPCIDERDEMIPKTYDGDFSYFKSIADNSVFEINREDYIDDFEDDNFEIPKMNEEEKEEQKQLWGTEISTVEKKEEKLNQILDKINASGIESLTKEEKDFLDNL